MILEERLSIADNAIIVTSRQGALYDNRVCEYRINRVDGGMAKRKPPPPLDELHPEVAAIFRRMEATGHTQKDLANMLGFRDDEANKVSLIRHKKRKMTVSEVAMAREALRMDEPPVEVRPRQIPIIGLVNAGSWREEIDNRGVRMMDCPDPRLPKHVFAVQVEGDSMDKVAAPGTNIVVDPKDRDLRHGKYYVVRNGDGEITFKQFFSEPARLEPASTNPEHKPIMLGSDFVEIIGRVVMQAKWL